MEAKRIYKQAANILPSRTSVKCGNHDRLCSRKVCSFAQGSTMFQQREQSSKRDVYDMIKIKSPQDRL